MNEYDAEDRQKGCHSSGFFFSFFCVVLLIVSMADLVPEEERKTLKQYRSVTSMLFPSLQSFMQVFSTGCSQMECLKSNAKFIFWGARGSNSAGSRPSVTSQRVPKRLVGLNCPLNVKMQQ